MKNSTIDYEWIHTRNKRISRIANKFGTNSTQYNNAVARIVSSGYYRVNKHGIVQISKELLTDYKTVGKQKRIADEIIKSVSQIQTISQYKKTAVKHIREEMGKSYKPSETEIRAQMDLESEISAFIEENADRRYIDADMYDFLKNTNHKHSTEEITAFIERYKNRSAEELKKAEEFSPSSIKDGEGIIYGAIFDESISNK